jgi:hypothetical protein
MPANSPIPFPDSRTDAPSIPTSDQGSVIPNSQSDRAKRILRAGSGQDKDPLLTAQVTWSLGHSYPLIGSSKQKTMSGLVVV